MTTEIIAMPLLNEGTDVWVRVQAETLPGGRYRVLGPMPDGEEWSFAPGDLVTVEARTFSDGSTGRVAVALSG